MKHQTKFGSRVCGFILVLAIIITLPLLSAACVTKTPATETSVEETPATETSVEEIPAKEVKDIKIGFAMYAMNCPYFVVMEDTAYEFAKEKGFKLVTTNADLKIEKQLQDVEDLISAQCDMIMIDPVDPIGTRQCIIEANKAGIPIMVFNDTLDLTPETKAVTTWVQDFFAIAKLAGRYAGENIDQKEVNIVLINGLPGVAAEWERKFGALEGLMEYQLEQFSRTTFRIISQGWGDWTYEKALTAMEDILAAFPDKKIDVIIAENDTMALGALKAVEEAGRLDELLFLAASADGQKEGIEAILNEGFDGKYICTGKNWPDENVIVGLEIALQIAQGKTDWPPVMHPEPELITKENVKEYYNPDAEF